MSYTSLKHKEVTIRKPRTCEFCCEKHEAGDKMHVEAGTHGGEFHSYYMCIPCKTYIYQNYADIVEDGEVYPDFAAEDHYKAFRASLNPPQRQTK